MPDSRVYVCFTMDCETIQEHTPKTGGPADWELAVNAMRGYVEHLHGRGHRTTLFLIPEVAEVQRDMLLELAALGADLGSHYHPQVLDCGYDGFLGEFDYPLQRQMLGECRDRFQAALGFPPTSFRGGNFSASDHTFPILSELGYRQGSVSLPGRETSAIASWWAGAEPWAHWAHETDRLRAGSLPFLELPCTAHPDDLDQEVEPAVARHLRIESPDVRQWAPEIVARNLDDQLRADHWMKTIIVMTHDTRRYADPDDQYRQTLEWLVELIEGAVADRGLELVPATLKELRATAGEPGA